MHALITRPEEDAGPLAEALRRRGVEVTVEPLLAVHPLPDAAVELDGVQALLFTSANGLRAFAALSKRRDLPVYAVGDASAALAMSVGFAEVASAAGNVEDLARLVIERLAPAGGPLLHVAGSAVAGDLAGRLQAAGFNVRRAVLYDTKPADRLSPALSDRLAAGGIDLALFFSPRTAIAFVELVRAADRGTGAGGVVAGCGNAVALCLSPAVAAEARALPWREVRSAARPDLPAMLELADAALAGAAEAPAQPRLGRALPSPAEAAASASKAGRQVGFAGITVAALVAAAVAAVVAGALTLWSGAPAPDESVGLRLADLAARLDALAGRAERSAGDAAILAERVDRAVADLAALPERLDRAAGDIDALRNQLAAEVQRPAGPSPDLSALLRRLDEAERRLDAAQASPPGIDPAAFERLHIENQALRTEIAALQGDVTVLRSATAELRAGSADRAAMVLAVGQLRAALADSRPYVDELAALRRLAAGDAALAGLTERLAPWAERGVPTLAQLQASFEEVAAAVAAPAPAEPSTAWTDRLLQRLRHLVSVRRVGADVEGDDPPARVARAEAMVGAADLAGAVAELDGIELPAVGKVWLDGARARLAAADALAALASAATAALDGSGG